MAQLIKKFIINGLFGYRNVVLDFSQSYKILIGENGIGKTTVLNCLYYTLTQRFKELANVKFNDIELQFGSNHVKFTRHQLRCYNQKDESANVSSFHRMLESNLTLSDLDTLDKLLFSDQNDSVVMSQVHDILSKRGVRINASDTYVRRSLGKVVMDYVAVVFSRNIEKLDKISNYSILYFPTYRRVESNINVMSNTFDNIRNRYPFIDDVDVKHLIQGEMMNFGMTDVKNRIKTLTSEIATQTREGFSNVLGEMLSVLAKNNARLTTFNTFEESKIDIVLSRLGDAINADDKKRILEYALGESNQDSKYLDFLISKLIKLYEDHREQDEAIKTFVKVCNYYLFDKMFVYDESQIDLFLESFHGRERLDLDCLSSGEKQIVSLFSRIFLEVGGAFFIIFDEPELSLSMRWQMRLLPDIISSGKCAFMIAATHSPFIIDNDMNQYAEALSDSLVEDK